LVAVSLEVASTVEAATHYGYGHLTYLFTSSMPTNYTRKPQKKVI
jgi:hypothetical protein